MKIIQLSQKRRNQFLEKIKFSILKLNFKKEIIFKDFIPDYTIIKMKQKRKTRYGIYLDNDIVLKAKKYQNKFVGVENLSGLIESLLNEWIKLQKEFEPLFFKFKEEQKQKQKLEDKKIIN